MSAQANKVGYTDQEFKDLKSRMKLISDSDPVNKLIFIAS